MHSTARWLALGGLVCALAFATVLTVRGADVVAPATMAETLPAA